MDQLAKMGLKVSLSFSVNILINGKNHLSGQISIFSSEYGITFSLKGLEANKVRTIIKIVKEEKISKFF